METSFGQNERMMYCTLNSIWSPNLFGLYETAPRAVSLARVGGAGCTWVWEGGLTRVSREGGQAVPGCGRAV